MTRSPFFRESCRLTRRRWLVEAGVAAGGLCLPAERWLSTVAAQGRNEKLESLNRFPRMVQEFFVEQVRQAERRSVAVKRALATKADAETHVKNVREKILSCFGPWPERTPLNARVTGSVERDVYRIEKVIFESRPEFLVTANLYLPKSKKFPVPGVVGSCGHSPNGKAGETYQSFAQALARMGYAVLIFDPMGQGERLQYVDDRLKPRRGVGTSEHLYAGNQQFLVGEFFGAWRAWDGIRALDYLLTREEVDPKHVGITGNSGGGTMTTWLCGVEPRWTMAAPGCFVTTFRRNVENELPADTEQCPPKCIQLGLDHDDFLAAMAPKPVMILAKERDYFDVRGAQEAFGRLKHLYTMLGAPENVALQIGPSEHGYTIENREAMYGWFNRVTGISQTVKEPELVIEKDETLQCTPHGQVAELGSRTVFSMTSTRAIELKRQRPARNLTELQAAVAKQLRLPQRMAPPEYRILRVLTKRGYPKPFATHYMVDTEDRVSAIVTRLSDTAHYSRPPRGAGPALLYVSHHSADVELREEPLIRELLEAEPEVPVFACDVRGVGDSRPNTCGLDQFLNPYGSDFFYAAHALMLDRPYVGQKTHDVLCVLDWLADHGYTEIHLAARGWGALPGAFAALLSTHVRRVTLKQALISYESIATSEEYRWPLSSFVPGVLSDFDLPDVYRALESRQLRQIEPAGPVPS